MSAKPLWSTAPEWAQYLAMDEDGTWYWYEIEPTLFTTVWDCEIPYRSEIADRNPEGWKRSLEKKPEIHCNED